MELRGASGSVLTQVARYAHMMKVKVTKASCKVRFRKFLSGSVLKAPYWSAGTVSTRISRSKGTSRRKSLCIVIRNVKNGCFADLITQSVPLNSTIEVNGRAFEIEGITKA